MIAAAWLTCLLAYERMGQLGEAGGWLLALSNPSDGGGRGGLARVIIARCSLRPVARSPCPFISLALPPRCVLSCDLLASHVPPPAGSGDARAAVSVCYGCGRAVELRFVDFWPVCGVCVGCALACVLGRVGLVMLYI